MNECPTLMKTHKWKAVAADKEECVWCKQRRRIELPAHVQSIIIDFDGGTPCNIPGRFGIGYGSYRITIRDGNVTHQQNRISHGRPMSNNAAEIFTLIKAIQHVLQIGHIREKTALHIRGDSQIAMKWVRGTTRSGKPAKMSAGTSEEFQNAVQSLRNILKGFARVETEWRGRKHAVSLFGH